jgi:hypothetical protein
MIEGKWFGIGGLLTFPAFYGMLRKRPLVRKAWESCSFFVKFVKGVLGRMYLLGGFDMISRDFPEPPPQQKESPAPVGARQLDP